MTDRILVTGGAGFIGRRVCQALLERGHDVRILDSLIEQVHQGRRPKDLPRDVELQVGDVRDGTAVSRALKGVDCVVHLAAEVGVGQSMYAIDRYVDVNDLGTATVFQQLVGKPVRRVVMASSMSIYGEGLYADADGRRFEDAQRASRRAADDPWDPVDDRGRPLTPLPTPEWKRPSLASVYALTKYVQERLTLTVAPAYGMEAVALRLFNVYGPGQALSNPYTGVLAIFAARLLNAQPPLIFEDGLQRRDFVHVEDVARAFVLAVEQPGVSGRVINIGSGQERSVTDVAASLADAMGVPGLAPEILGKARVGDIRHCFADVSLAESVLGFRAERDFAEGMKQLADWVARQEAEDKVHDARRELEARGLVA